MKGSKYITGDLNDLVEKMLFIDRYTRNFLLINPGYNSNYNVTIDNKNMFILDFKVWKMN